MEWIIGRITCLVRGHQKATIPTIVWRDGYPEYQPNRDFTICMHCGKRFYW